jgi:hypothetical protein
MTNLEALQANLSDVHGIVLSTNTWAKALEDEGIVADDPYDTATERKQVDMATIRIYRLLLGGANMSEGGLSYSLSEKEHIKSCIDMLLTRWGLATEFKQTVKGISCW